MTSFLKDVVHHLTGRYTEGVINCKSYSVIQFLKQTNYKGEFYEGKKISRSRRSASPVVKGN